MTKPKVVTKSAKKIVVVEPDVEPVVETPAPPVKPVDPAVKLEKMLRELKMNDARARLKQAHEANNPDAILACMDEILKLEEEGKS